MTTRDRHAHVEGNDFVVEIEGDIDYQVGPVLFDELLELLEDAGSRRLVLDMAGVPFLDSSGIRALLRINALSEAFALRGLRPQIERVINIVAPGVLAIES
jgi:anti-sigma B factor antagonist